MHKKEIIILDARLLNVIRNATFEAILENGHRFVAYVEKINKQPLSNLKAGMTVQVCMSPYDMSKGSIVFND